jgi:hypothetical protein
VTPRWSGARTALTGATAGLLASVLVAGLAGPLAWWQALLVGAAVGALVGWWGGGPRHDGGGAGR